MKRAVCILALMIAACHAPRSRFETARARLDAGDLLAALVDLDRVAPHEPEYAEARSLAAAVERRIRTGQRLFARGLALRAQWRDEEALQCFELAREVWPDDGAAVSLLAATRHRIAALTAAEPSAASASGDEVRTEPVGSADPLAADGTAIATAEVVTSPSADDVAGPESSMATVTVIGDGAGEDPPAAPLAETGGPGMGGEPTLPGTEAPDAATAPDVVGVPEVATAPEAEAASDVSTGSSGSSEAGGAGAPPAEDVRLRAELGRAVTALRAGRLDDALRVLRELRRIRPASDEVSALLVRVLHQRALLHYGQGELALAVDAWDQVLEIDPKHAQARSFRDAARSELEALKRR